MNAIHFEPVGERNLSAFCAITRETVWLPAWPGDEAFERDLRRWPRELQKAAYLIYRERELIGRVIAPQFDDYLIVRDLGLRAQANLAEAVAQAIMRRAKQQDARVVRVIVFEPFWNAFSRLGFTQQKRRATMQLELSHAPLTPRRDDVRNVMRADIADVGELMYDAYHQTVDDEGEDPEQWTSHTRDIVEGQYGAFLASASFITPPSPPFHSSTLVIENAPRGAILAQVVTRRSQANRGYARRLITHSLTALAALDYERCFLEVTLSNANAVHLYRTLGFTEIGPAIVYGLKP